MDRGITTWYFGPTLTFAPIRPPLEWLYKIIISLYAFVKRELGGLWKTLCQSPLITEIPKNDYTD
jgi:hypothetical protein